MVWDPESGEGLFYLTTQTTLGNLLGLFTGEAFTEREVRDIKVRERLDGSHDDDDAQLEEHHHHQQKQQ
jgi:hypothetical protein